MRSADARRFNSCDAGAKLSWGFPTFIKRQDVAKMGLLSGPRGALVIRAQLDTSIMAVTIVTGGASAEAGAGVGAATMKNPRPEVMAAAAKAVAAGSGARPGTAPVRRS